MCLFLDKRLVLFSLFNTPIQIGENCFDNGDYFIMNKSLSLQQYFGNWLCYLLIWPVSIKLSEEMQTLHISELMTPEHMYMNVENDQTCTWYQRHGCAWHVSAPETKHGKG